MTQKNVKKLDSLHLVYLVLVMYTSNLRAIYSELISLQDISCVSRIFSKIINFQQSPMAAKHYPAEALDNPLYEPMDGLTRCLHFSDLKQCYKKRMLVPHTLKSKAVVIPSGVGKVSRAGLWARCSSWLT